MSSSPEFAISEAGGVQLQALTTLANMGWQFLSRKEVDAQRHGRRSLVILEDVARESLARINGFEQDGVRHAFTASAIQEALSRLRDIRFDGLLKTNELATDMLLLGTAMRQEIAGIARERQLQFIAWGDRWRENSFHMTAEMTVDGRGECIRPDIVLFVNGIPFASVEVKRSTEKTSQGISQTLRNQNLEFGAPTLFTTMQVLIAGNSHQPRYATIGTPEKYWSVWHEPDCGGLSDTQIAEIVNAAPPPLVMEKVYADFFEHAKRHRELHETGARWVTDLDTTLVGLCRPDRLLDLTRRFTLFDKGAKKIARYQQVSAVNRMLERVQARDEQDRRKGGVVWHTQGSGKSLTMVMFARALAYLIPGARILIVTDRRDLDRQLKKTFQQTGLSPVQAKTGRHLMELCEGGAQLITTLVMKFRAGLRERSVRIEDRDVFVLVDESHRSHYGNDISMHEDMRRVFPNACYIGFTGTPLTKRDRNTFLKFGELIDRYTIDQAVADGAVVPLLYEGRQVREDLNEAALDAWFDRDSTGLSDEQKAELKRRMSRPGVIQAVPARLKAIAWDVRQHFIAGFAGTGLKGQVVAPSKMAAVRLQALFDALNEADDSHQVTTEVVISAPDKRESHEDIEDGPREEVQQFWNRMMKRFGDEDAYNTGIIESFDSPESPDLIIVVSKLLTGFDVQRNTVLYLAQPLKEHNLLQAIARVNRVFDAEDAPPKPFGYIVDYCGVLENLSSALTSYRALQDFDQADISAALLSISAEADRLPELHAALLDLFKDVANRFDQEAYALALRDEARREALYRALSAYSGCLNVALGSRQFIETTPADRLARYKNDLRRFELLRRDVARRYGEAVDWKKYEARVQRLLDQHIVAHDVSTVVAPLNVFDAGALEEELGEGAGRTDASIADEIASRMTHTINIKLEQDPGFYKNFSAMVRETIEAFRQRRIDEREYLRRIRELHAQGVAREQGRGADVPATLHGDGDAIAIWTLLRQELQSIAPTALDNLPEVSRQLLGLIERERRVGWQDDVDAQNRIRSHFDDFFFDEFPLKAGFELSPDAIDRISDQVLSLARERLPR